MNTFKIILADDHPVIRQYLKEILSADKEMEVVAEVGDGVELLDTLNHLPVLPDMVILDISMPRMPGLDAAREIKARFPEIRLLIVSMHDEGEYVSQAFLAGVEGYLLKENASSELFAAINTIRRGKPYTSDLLLHVP